MPIKKLLRRPVVAENDSTIMPSELVQNNELLLSETEIASLPEQSEDESALDKVGRNISLSNSSEY